MEIRMGKISSVNQEKCAAKVLFEQLDNMVSDDLSIVTRNGTSLTIEELPKINQPVLCLFLDESSDGFILGSWKVN